MIQLILGGARSGKSRYAESQAKLYESQGSEVIYIATAQYTPVVCGNTKEVIQDFEMQERIQRHRADRPAHWKSVECPVKLSECLQRFNHQTSCILIDCLTLWVLNLLESNSLEKEKTALLTVLPTLKSNIILVSNEVGLGVVPMGKITRRFVDELGWLHQEVAACADQVVFVTAGLPRRLK